MSQKLKDKTAVVTGGAGGIGFEIVNCLLANDVKLVIIIDINELNENVANNLNSRYGINKSVFIKYDITKDLTHVVDEIFSCHENVDLLINSAGIARENLIKMSVNVNVTALIECTYMFWNRMRVDKGGKGGTIINICSIYSYKIIPISPVYQAAKFAAYGFTKSLGHQYNLKKSDVRVVAVCPGHTRTNLRVDIEEPDILEDLFKIIQHEEWQEPIDVGRGVIEVFDIAESGSAWLIEGGKRPKNLSCQCFNKIF